MNLRDLEYLVALAEHRHFGRAAEASHVSQPTLSTQIRKLERELGVELLERHPRQVMLTGVGEQIVERARRVLQETDAIRDQARLARDPASGRIRIGLFPTLAPYLLPHVIPTLHHRFPDLEVLLVEEKTETVVEQLRGGKLDAGILALPIDDEQLAWEPLFEEAFLLAVPSDHPLAGHEGPAPASVLQDERVLLLEDGHCLRDQALSVCRMVGAEEYRGFRATSLETLRQMVGAGVGVTLLPELAVSSPVPASPDITILRFADPVPTRQIAMFWRRTNPYREFLPTLAAIFRDLPDAPVRVGTFGPGEGPPAPAASLHAT